MGMRGTCCTAAALALIGAPTAQADRAMSVGYSTPSALHGHHATQPSDARVILNAAKIAGQVGTGCGAPRPGRPGTV